MTKLENVFSREITLEEPTDNIFEIHRRHRDIFIVLDGEVKFIHSILYSGVSKYDSEKDIQKVEVQLGRQTTIARAGDCVIFDPGEAHKPNMKAGTDVARVLLIKELV